ncbi:TRAP transporter substrate-binding protein [Aquamicrobium zhengzhouense]|uniref:TRAP transporter substrate-binding protein n=1 Tax=Aquamicrobium zhengzhouense TaxID=2781738 RepID=A0ABS0S7K9_9HYPH|nr:TRAP transporter substrate-binding protein [Aquamicrobium zhengzhouense]MBI1619274.1 TRAP transporter substrate-binding protein [Aquamicrobium zhengzhouense]
MIRRTSVALAALLAASVLPVKAAEVEFSLAHWLPPTHPMHTGGIAEWADSVSKASDGRIKINIFPAAQLGSAADHYDMARDGIADIGYVNPGYQAGRFPIYSLIEVPFHVREVDNGSGAIHEWYAKYAEIEMPDVKFCLTNPHDPGTIHANTEIKVPADIKGKNIRAAHATMARFVSLLGGSSVQVPANEARDAISKGMADAITFPWNSVYIFGIDPVVNHHLDFPFYISNQLLLINRGAYDGLSDENRKVIDEHCTPEWSQKFSAGWAENERSGRQKMIDSGTHILYQPTEDEIALWREAAAPLVDQWKEDVRKAGQDPDAIYEEYRSALQKYGSLY